MLRIVGFLIIVKFEQSKLELSAFSEFRGLRNLS